MDKLKSRSAIRNRDSSFSRNKILAQYNDGRTVSPVNKRRRSHWFKEDQQINKPRKLHQYKLYNNFDNSQSENNSIEASTDENGVKLIKNRCKNKSTFYQKNVENSKNPFTNNLKNYLQSIAVKENVNNIQSDVKPKSLRQQIHLKNNLERINSLQSNSNSRSNLKISQIGDSFQFRQSNMDDTNLYSDIGEFEHLKRQIEGQDQTAQFQSSHSCYKLEDKQDSEIIKAYQNQKLQKLQKIYYQHLKDNNENEMNAKIILGCLTPEQQIDYMHKIISNTSKKQLLDSLSSKNNSQNVFKDQISTDKKINKRSIDQILSHDDNLILTVNTQGSFELKPFQDQQKINNVKQKIQTMQELMEQIQSEVQTFDKNDQSQQKIVVQFQKMVENLKQNENQKILKNTPKLKIMTSATECRRIKDLEIQQTPKLDKINIKVSKSPQQKRNNNFVQYGQISKFEALSPHVKQHLQNLQKPQFEIKQNFKLPKYKIQKEVYDQMRDQICKNEILKIEKNINKNCQNLKQLKFSQLNNSSTNF